MQEKQGITLDSAGRLNLQAGLELKDRTVKKKKVPCDKCGGVPPLHTNECPIEFRELMIRYGGRKADVKDEDDGEGIRFVSEEFDARSPEQLRWNMDELPPLSKKLQGLVQVLLSDTLLRAYKFSTSGGRIKLRDLDSAKAALDTGASSAGMSKFKKMLTTDISELDKVMGGSANVKKHLDKVKQFIKSGFEGRMKELKISMQERDLMIYHLVHEAEVGFAKIEERDPGVTTYMLDLLARQLKDMNIFPAELEQRFEQRSRK